MKNKIDVKVPLARALTMLVLLGVITKKEIDNAGKGGYEGLDKLLQSKMKNIKCSKLMVKIYPKCYTK